MPANTLWPLQYDWVNATPEQASGEILQERLTTELLSRSPDDAVPPKLIAFGRYIQALRRKKRLSRKVVAERGGIDPLALALLEGGILSQDEVSDMLVARVALGLEVRRAELALDPFRVDQPLQAPRGSWIDDVRRLLASLAGPAVPNVQLMGPIGWPAPVAPTDLPIALPLVEIVDEGRTLVLAMTLVHARQGGGQADLEIQVSDDTGCPQRGVGIVLIAPNLAKEARTPSDGAGKARIGGINPRLLAEEGVGFVVGQTELDRTIRVREATLAKVPRGNPHRPILIRDLIDDYAKRIEIVGDERDIQRRDDLEKET